METSLKSELILLIDNESADLNSIFQAASLIKKRFKFNVSLYFSEPALLFDSYNELLQSCDYNINRIGISDKHCYLGDMMEFGKRFDCDKVLFIDLRKKGDDLILSLISLLVNCIENSSSYYINSESTAFVAIDTDELRKLRTRNFSQFIELVDYLKSAGKRLPSSSLVPDLSEINLYLTHSFVKRFGGLKKLLSYDDLYFGEHAISSYQNIWVLCHDDEQDLLGKVEHDSKQVMFVSSNVKINNSNYLIDINPTLEFGNCVKAETNICAPRLLLSIRKSPIDNLPTRGAQCVFAMSNFNKQKYIAGAVISVLLQEYSNISLQFVDDNSSDESVSVAQLIRSKLSRADFEFKIRRNLKNKGTYWIRNSIICESSTNDTIYFVNDSDDFSSSFRARIQVAQIQQSFSSNESVGLNFGDIVRVDDQFEILPLDGKVERYGTASLSALSKMHDYVGYYENIMKNADTEFIERMKYFYGKQSVNWFRYPILFQPFDGGNLTSDIYKRNESGELCQHLTNRDIHRELFTALHQNTSKADLSKVFSFPTYQYPKEYKDKLSEFLIGD